ncbi:UNVERIFIED_CONTAM: hypothetical protein Sradi_0177300 [Sesamum radiatum]|uniref:Uncharacterized protein n=1 Tax=Sesamum radiatum TaxID=300843 RepID=A0AAW2VYA3_SESRA
MDELSPALMGAIQRIVSAAIREQLVVLTPARTITPSDEDVLEELAEEGAPVHVLPIVERQGPLLVASQKVPPQWLARFECLQKGLQDVQYQIIKRAPSEEQQGIPFSEEIMQTTSPSIGRSPTYRSTMEPRIHMSTSPTLRILPFSIVTPLGSSVAYS